jgi:hypothetical protein
MRADEFEKKIRDKMGGFELVPGGEVWEQVSARISKEKRKRRVLVYWLLFGVAVLTGATGLWFIKDDSHEKIAINETVDAPQADSYKVKLKTDNSLQKLNAIKTKEEARNITYFKKSDVKDVVGGQAKKLFKPGINTAKMLVENPQIVRADENNKVYKEEEYAQKPLPLHRFYNPAVRPTNDYYAMKDKIAGKKDVHKDTMTKAVVEKNIDERGKANNKWSVGFTVYSGISNNVSGLPLFENKNYTQDYLYSPVPNEYTGNYSTIALNNFRSSFSFGFGFFVKKHLAKKTRLSAGLDYHLYKAKSAVGSKVNQQRTFYDSLLEKSTVVNEYHTVGNSTTYWNQYHLLKLPVNVEYQLNGNQNKPLIILAGISPGYMFSSNALYANPSVNVFYVDKQKFNRFQLSMQAGLSLPIVSFSGYLVSGGPVLEYTLTNVSKTYDNRDQHLVFTGIKANIIFK